MYTNLPTAMHKRSAWINCGVTCQAIIELAGASYVPAGIAVDYLPGNEGALFALLTAPVGIYTVMDIAIYDIHEFMVDLHPGGGRSLVNGYQGEYGGLWWCGASLNNQNGNARRYAEAWGKGEDIQNKFRTLAERLRSLLSCGTWGGATIGGTSALNVWKSLPFFPDDPRVAHWVQTNQPIRMSVRRFTVPGILPAPPMGYMTNFASPAIVATEAQALGVFAVW